MIIEYFTSEGVVHSSKTDPRIRAIIPRKNETVCLAGKEYCVRSVSHELDHEHNCIGRTFTVHKVSVELI